MAFDVANYVLRRRPTALVMALIGAMIFIVFVLRTEDTRREVIGDGGIRERIIKQEQENPCNDLTTRQCALKLFRSLSPSERRDVERRIIAEERRIRRQVRRQQRRLERQSERRGSAPTPSDDGSSTSTPAPESRTPPQQGGSGGGGGGAGGGTPEPGQPPSSPSAEVADEPVVRTPSVTVPQTPATPPVTVPSIEVPCVELAPLVNC